MLVAIFEREGGDAGFVEIAEAFSDHAVVLFLCRARATDRGRDCAPARQRSRSPWRVRGGEKAATLALLHVFAVGSSTREDDVEMNGISCGKIIKIEAPDFRLVMEGQI